MNDHASTTRRDPRSVLVSCLLLAGLAVGGAGFFSQHYRIEFVPKNRSVIQGTQGTAAPAGGESGAGQYEPEVILVDGCDIGEQPTLARAPVPPQPRRLLANKARNAGKALVPCDEDSQTDPERGGEATPQLALLSTLTEWTGDESTVDGVPFDGLSLPGASSTATSVGGESGSAIVVPGLASLVALGPVGGGITSLPAVETTGSGPTGLQSSSVPSQPVDEEVLVTPLPDPAGGGPAAGSDPNMPSASVPEPATLGLLGIGLLGAAVARRRRPA